MKNIAKYGAVSALSLVIGASAAFAENIKIAFIDPLSGPFASTGTNGLHQFEFAADYMALYFRRALPDSLDPGVAPQAL